MDDLSYESFLAQQSEPDDLSYDAYLAARGPKRTLGQRASRVFRSFMDAGAASTIPLYKYGSKAVDALLPGRPAQDWAERQVEEFEASRAAQGAPGGFLEKAAGVAGGLVGYGSQAMLTGAGVGGAIARYAPAGSRLARVGQLASSEGRGLRAILARQAAGTALTSPFDLLQAADPETSVSSVLGREEAGLGERVATELGTSFVAGSAVDALLGGVKQLRKTTLGQNPNVPPSSAPPPGVVVQQPPPLGPTPGFAQMDQTAQNVQLRMRQQAAEQELLQQPPSPISQAVEDFDAQVRNARLAAEVLERHKARRAQTEANNAELKRLAEEAESQRMAALAKMEDERRAAETKKNQIYEEPPEDIEPIAAVVREPEEFVAQSAIRSPDGKVYEEPEVEPVKAGKEPEPEPPIVERLRQIGLRDARLGNTAPGDIANLSKAEREALDNHLVAIKHPLAEQAGTVTYRAQEYARELADADPKLQAEREVATRSERAGNEQARMAELAKREADEEIAAAQAEAKRVRDVADEPLPRVKWSKAWNGAISANVGSQWKRGGPDHLVTDGVTILTRESADAALPKATREKVSLRTVNAEAIEKVWDDAVKGAKLDAVPTSKWQQGDEIPRVFFTVDDDVVAVDANRFASIQKLKPTSWKSPKPGAVDSRKPQPVVAYRGDTPIAALVPLSGKVVDDEVRAALKPTGGKPKKPKKGEAGFASPGAVQAIAGAGTGAAVGAAANEDDPVAGALAGAAIGAGGVAAAKYLTQPASGKQHIAPGTVPPQQPNFNTLSVKQMQRGQGGMKGGRATAYERGVTQGTVGQPKSFDLVPSVAGLVDPGRELDLALQRVRQNSPIRQAVSDAEVQRIARRVGVADLLGSERTSLTPPEMQALGDFIRAGEKEMYDLAEALTKTSNPQQIADLDDKFAAALRATSAAAAKLDQAASEHGRGLRLLQHLAKNPAAPTFWQQMVARHFRHDFGVFSGGAKAQEGLNRLLKQYSMVGPNGTIVLTKDGQKAVADYVWKITAPQGVLDLAADFRRAGLLTNPATHGANVSSNLTFGEMENVTHLVASTLDRLLSGGDIQKRSIMASVDQVKAYHQELLRGLQGKGELKVVLKDLDEYAAQGHKRAYYNPDKIKGVVGDRAAEKIMSIAQAYSDKVYGALSWEDKLFRGAAMLASLEERARLRALKEGLRKGTAAFDARVKQLSTWATAHIDDRLGAKLDGEVATFTDPNKFAAIVNQAKNQLREQGGASRVGGFLLEMIAPFVKTPSNVVYRGYQYSPVGLATATPEFMNLAWKRITGKAVDKAPEEVRQLLMRFSRGTVGTALFGLGLALYADGKAVGSTPAQAAPRADREQANIPPTSVKFGDHWVNVVRTMGPVGMAIITGAQWAQGMKEDNESGVAAAVGGFVPVLAEQPLMEGVQSLAEIVSGRSQDRDKPITRMVGSTAGSFVPAGVAAAARAKDPVASRRRETLSDYLKDRVPGMREELQPRRSPLGDVEQSRGLGEFLPGRPTRGREDQLTQEQRRLHTGTQAVRRLRMANGSQEPEELFRARREFADSLVEESLQKLVGSAKFQRAAPQEQQEMWQERVEETRAKATRKFKGKHKAEYRDLGKQPRTGYKNLNLDD